jgi:hypothetical protein
MDKKPDIKEINNKNSIIQRPPWIITGKTMSNECYKFTMDMIDKQPPKKIPVYKKINLKK